MPTANEKSIWTESFKAGGDLRTKQYRAVKLTANRTVSVFDTVTEVPVGILLNAPNTGEEALVCVVGRCPVVLGGTVATHALICFGVNALAKAFVATTDTTKYCAGRLLRGGAINNMGMAMIQCAVPRKGDAVT